MIPVPRQGDEQAGHPCKEHASVGVALQWIVMHRRLCVPASVRRGQNGGLLLTVQAPSGAGYTQWGMTYSSVEDAKAGAQLFVQQLVRVGLLSEPVDEVWDP